MPKHLNPLEKKLAARIEADGALSIADFMQLALYDPGHGYYTTQSPFSDFITAPEITPLFGEVIAVWVVSTWQDMLTSSAENAFNLIECGPGRGTLMNDVLRTLKKIAPDVYAAANVHLVEISPRLTAVQQEALAAHNVTWHTNIKTVPNTSSTLIIGNEFFDAFPIEQYVRINNTWQERAVGYDAERGLCFVTRPNKTATQNFPTEADFHETSVAQDAWLTDLYGRFGALPIATLFIDYGITDGDTLQALKAHEFVPVLEYIGQADITAHVDFSRLADQLKNAHIIDFNTFLTQYGLPLRLNTLLENADDNTKAELMRVAERLLSPKQMGVMFKCLLHRQNF